MITANAIREDRADQDAPKDHSQAVVETLRQQLKDCIRTALAARYTSYSSQNRIETGNAYQSVQLGDEVTQGFRTLRRSVLAGLPLKGAKVLDLGCNMGELSRLARQCGAALVDGFEYDPYFIQIGQAINAVNGVQRVSLFQRDITDPKIYRETYDIVMVFSVFTYARRVLPQIAESCGKMLLLETHKITEGWTKEYIRSLQPYFPNYCIVQRTDWAKASSSGARLLIAYARTPEMITRYILRRHEELGADGDDVRYLDVRQSRPAFMQRFRGWLEAQRFAGIDDLRQPVREALADIGDATQADDFRSGVSGVTYWLALLQGYFEYRDKGAVTDDNFYRTYFRRIGELAEFDPHMRFVVGDDVRLTQRVELRFRDLEAASGTGTLLPILIFNPMADSGEMPSLLHDAEHASRLMYSHQDGYHRHVAAFIAGLERLPYRAVWHPQASPFVHLAEAHPGLEQRLLDELAQD